MHKILKVFFPVGVLLLFLLTYLKTLKGMPSLLFEGLYWLSMVIIIFAGLALLGVMMDYYRNKDYKGAFGVLVTILVFAVLIFLLLAYQSSIGSLIL